jgi:hypothetical protein
MSTNPSWQFESPSAKKGGEERRCCRCDAVIPTAEAKYNTSERGYVCLACTAKKRREFLIKFFGTLGVGLAAAAFFILRLLRKVDN